MRKNDSGTIMMDEMVALIICTVYEVYRFQ